MPAGIRIRNDAGAIQIDETYVNFVLVGKGSTTIATTYFAAGGTAGRTVYRTDITVTGRTAPLLAIKSSQAVVVEKVTVSGGSWTWRVLANATTSIDWYCFDLAPVEETDTFGLAVFNAAGDPVFHSSQKPLRIAAAFGYGDGDGFYIDTVPAVSLTAGRAYAAIQLAMGGGEWVQEESPAEQKGNWYSGSEAGTGQVRYARVLTALSNSGNSGGSVIEYKEGSFLAVDVTNY